MMEECENCWRDAISQPERIEISVTKHIQYFYVENHKTLMKDIKDLTQWGDILYSWIGRFNRVEMAVLPQIGQKI